MDRYKKSSRDNPLHSGLQLPKGEHSYHGLNLITDPGASIARGISIRSEKPLNGFFSRAPVAWGEHHQRLFMA
ncbi:hypothetical protein J9Z47_005051 [Salmonella enterica]|nr:hypothetical protein [Salmonella enterica]